MRSPLWLVLFATSCVAHATILDLGGGGHVSFPYDQDSKLSATWGAEGSPLDISEKGLGCSKCTGNSFVFAWVMTSPIPLGSHGQPWDNADISVSVPRTKPDDSFALGNAFIRYSPDQKHWTTWQVLERQSEKSEAGPLLYPYKITLAIPRSTQENYDKLCAEFTATDPSRPFQHADAVRWILQKNPEYFSREIPFIGYVQVLVETGLSDQQRIKGIHVSASSLIDQMIKRLKPQERGQLQGKWSFVADDLPTTQ